MFNVCVWCSKLRYHLVVLIFRLDEMSKQSLPDLPPEGTCHITWRSNQGNSFDRKLEIELG